MSNKEAELAEEVLRLKNRIRKLEKQVEDWKEVHDRYLNEREAARVRSIPKSPPLHPGL